ncbi:MAG TPA: hypothetical protein DCS42_13475, partial [Nitrospiraceae bacterium]|nr:hypothetical protein [Nitrospiraceae bacterium]
MYLFIFYGTYILIAIAVSVSVCRWMKKRGTGKALVAGGLSVVVLALFFPIPIHGGFTFLVEVMLSELRAERTRMEQAVKNERKEDFKARLAARFNGPLVFSVRKQITEQWSSITAADGTQGWHHAGSGLVWTDMLALEGTRTPPELDRAKAFCAALAPISSWALPTEAELSLFWKAGGYGFSPLGNYGTISMLEDIDLLIEMPVVRI